jgi:hypothetical protein
MNKGRRTAVVAAAVANYLELDEGLDKPPVWIRRRLTEVYELHTSPVIAEQ